MTGLLIKILLLAIAVVWTLRKILEWVSRQEGPYGQLASAWLALLNEFGRGLSRTILWTLIVILLLLLSRRALTPRDGLPEKPAVEAAGESALLRSPGGH